MNKVYKYQTNFDEINNVCNCPQSEYFEYSEKESFRFVFSDNANPNNFLPPAKINPKRFLAKSELERCEALGLSMYGKKSGAIHKFNDLITTFKNFKKVIGTHIAIGIIEKEDGHITGEDEITHFDMYEFKDIDLSKKFNIIEEL
jgi:hypothetical protein